MLWACYICHLLRTGAIRINKVFLCVFNSVTVSHRHTYRMRSFLPGGERTKNNSKQCDMHPQRQYDLCQGVVSGMIYPNIGAGVGVVICTLSCALSYEKWNAWFDTCWLLAHLPFFFAIFIFEGLVTLLCKKDNINKNPFQSLWISVVYSFKSGWMVDIDAGGC